MNTTENKDLSQFFILLSNADFGNLVEIANHIFTTTKNYNDIKRNKNINNNINKHWIPLIIIFATKI